MGANQPQPSSHAGHHTATTSDGSRQLAENASAFEQFLLPVGMAGFEPATSCSQSRRANQAALHPVVTREPRSLSRARTLIPAHISLGNCSWWVLWRRRRRRGTPHPSGSRRCRAWRGLHCLDVKVIARAHSHAHKLVRAPSGRRDRALDQAAPLARADRRSYPGRVSPTRPGIRSVDVAPRSQKYNRHDTGCFRHFAVESHRTSSNHIVVPYGM